MRPPIDWLAVTLLIGLIGPPRIAANAADSLRVTGSREPETQPSAIAQQSPIDIRGDDLQVVKKQAVPPLTFHYSTHATVDLENTGSPNEEATVRGNVAAGDAEIRVGDRVYRLVQFHFHTPAEHEVDEQQFPMEMHLVHKAADSSTLVIGVFLRAGAANATLAPMFSQLPKQSGAHAKVTQVDLSALIPHHEESARYTGSLTTPPFTVTLRASVDSDLSFAILVEIWLLSSRSVGRSWPAAFANAVGHGARLSIAAIAIALNFI